MRIRARIAAVRARRTVSAAPVVPPRPEEEGVARARHIIGWADTYETSKLATARRFVDLSDTPAAIILSEEGVVEYSHRKKNAFPFIELKSGQSVPKKSLTQRFSGTGDGCSSTDETEPSFWTNSGLRRGTTMCEQVLVQGKGYRITLLTIDQAEAEDDDDEHERERSEWRPGFR